jgi:hypothetical protein
MTGESAIRIMFVAKNPFTGNDVSTWWRRNESPSVIVHEGIVFLLHGLTPGRITKRNEVVVRNRRGNDGGQI